MSRQSDATKDAAEASRLPQSSGAISRLYTLVRERGLTIGCEIVFNILLPFLVYGYAEEPWGTASALMASSTPPIAWSIIQFARRRRIDALSILVLSGIALSLLAFMAGGSLRMLQLREKLITAGVGIVFLASAALGRPLMYQLARAAASRGGSSELSTIEAMKNDARFRHTMTVMTVVWGSGLVAEAALAAMLVFAMSIRQYLIVGPLVGYGTFGSLGLWSFFYAGRRRREAIARQIAESETGAVPRGS